MHAELLGAACPQLDRLTVILHRCCRATLRGQRAPSTKPGSPICSGAMYSAVPHSVNASPSEEPTAPVVRARAPLLRFLAIENSASLGKPHYDVWIDDKAVDADLISYLYTSLPRR